MRRIISVLFISFFAMTMFAQKYKTINVVPDNASIIMRGSEVGTGSYDLAMSRSDEYVLLKFEAPGYITKTVKVYRNDRRKVLSYTLEKDEAFMGSESSSDLANKAMVVNVREGMTEDEAWQSITYYISDLFPNLEVQDHAAGWMRSSWEIQSYAYNTVRTKIEIKRVPGQKNIRYRIKLSSEIAWNDCGLDSQCFTEWPRLLKKYKESIEMLMSALQ